MKRGFVFALAGAMLIFFCSAAWAAQTGYFYDVSHDVDGHPYGDYGIDDPRGFLSYVEVTFDAQGRISAYDSYWKGEVYSSNRYEYLDDGPNMARLDTTGRSGESTVEYVWSGDRLASSRTSDKDGNLLSRTDYERNGNVVEYKTYKSGKLVYHGRYVYADRRNVDYWEGNLQDYKQYRYIYRADPNVYVESRCRFGSGDYQMQRTFERDAHFSKTKAVSRMISSGKVTSEALYENGLQVGEINYQEEKPRRWQFKYNEADLLEGIDFFVQGDMYYSAEVERDGAGTVTRTVGYLPDGRVFARCPGRIVRYFKNDGSSLHGDECRVLLPVGWK